MLERISRPMRRRRTGGALLAATAMVSTVLVSATTGISSAEAVSTKVPLVCVGADAATRATLDLAKGLIGTDKILVDMTATSADIPSNAGLGAEIDATFKWTGTMSQDLIDKAAGLNVSLDVSNVKSTMQIKGPSDIDAFQANGVNTTFVPQVGKPAQLNMGTLGGKITTTNGGIITYRVAGVTMTVDLKLGAQKFTLNLTCPPGGSNLIAKTTVKDPNAPTFSPEVLKLDAEAGGTVEADLLGDVIKPGKTPLMPESLKIVESPSAGKAEIVDGKFRFTAPNTAGTFSTTVEICGEPNPDSGIPGVNEVQKLQLGDNWQDGVLGPRPVGFTLKYGDQETGVIWTAKSDNPFAPFPRGKTPNSKDWAPENRAGQVNDYLTLVSNRKPSTDDIKKALEALPNIGAGNLEVTALYENPKNDKSVTGYSIKFVGALAETDVPPIELAGWFAVPPQEVMDRLSAAIAGLAGSLGGGEGEPAVNPLDAAAGIKDGDSQSKKAAKADKYIGDKILAGKKVSDAEWDWWVGIRIMNPIMDAVPDIIAWITSLFPKKVLMTTLVAGETSVPPEPMCAQGIIDVTVAAAAVDGEQTGPGGNPAAVLPKVVERKLGITG